MANDKPAPAHAQTVTLYLRVRGAADAIAYYEKAFGAVERPGRLSGPDGKIMHASLTIGNSEVMLSDEFPEWDSPGPQTLGGSSVSIALSVPDVDAVVERAVAAGATIQFPVADQFYGQRSGRIKDPFGHVWVVGTTIETVSPDEMTRRAAAWTVENR
ncbi:MAG: PhnB protein [Candidatus Eremiobacteraeota bacterium]|jgi:PhnB protein|nr:PhnB protein [Candidatus Eremiobacteraeota bacterium]